MALLSLKVTPLNCPQHYLDYPLLQGQGQLPGQVQTVMVAYGAYKGHAKDSSHPEIDDR